MLTTPSNRPTTARAPSVLCSSGSFPVRPKAKAPRAKHDREHNKSRRKGNEHFPEIASLVSNALSLPVAAFR
jgi:hypothetical protein